MLTLIKNRGWNRIKAAVGYTPYACIQLHVFERSEELGLYYFVVFFFLRNTLCALQAVLLKSHSCYRSCLLKKRTKRKMQWSYATVQLTFYMDQGRKTRVYRLTLIPPPPQKTPDDVRPQHHSRPFFSSLCPENRPSPPPEMSYRGPISLLTFCPFCPVSQVSIGGVIFAKLFFSPLFVFFFFKTPTK